MVLGWWKTSSLVKYNGQKIIETMKQFYADLTVANLQGLASLQGKLSNAANFYIFHVKY